MIEEHFYIIRHKATGQLMPLMKKGKGYTHWNPDNPKQIIAEVVGCPRILASEKQAKTVIRMWFQNPNAEYRGYTTHLGEGDYDICIKDDGRKLEDLEVVPVKLTEISK